VHSAKPREGSASKRREKSGEPDAWEGPKERQALKNVIKLRLMEAISDLSGSGRKD
jgi:hypothetical protein